MLRGRPRRRAAAVALGLGLVATFGGRAGAGDDDERAGVLPRRVYDCGLLTAASKSYRREAVPAPAKEADDAFDPVLPRATDDGTRSVGSVDAVIDAVKAGPPPGAFTHEGERILALGPSTIVVDASEEVHRAVADSLATLSQPATEVGVVDVVVLGGDVPADAQDPSAAVAGGARVLAVGR